MTNCCGPTACGPSGTAYFRRYENRDEKRARLEAYAAELENELTAVKERLEELRSA